MQYGTSNKPRILILTIGFAIGGAEKVIVNISKALRKDFEFLVVSLRGDGPLRSILQKEGIKTFILGGKSPFDLRIFLRLNLLIKRVKPHIIHSHLLKANWIGRIIAYLNKIPEISSIHTVSTFLNPIEVLIERYTAPLATVNVCCSKYVALDNTVKIKHPFNFYIYNAIETRNNYLKKVIDPYKLLVVSRLDLKQKAFLELIEAISILNKNGQKFSLDIYGEGSDLEVLKEKIHKVGLEKIVILKGFTSDPEAIMSRYSVFILPSKIEGLPISILEAISSGLVVVASSVGGIPEIIEDSITGFLIDGYSPENIVKTLLRVVERSDDLPNIAINARRKLDKTFKLEQSIFHWKKLYTFLFKKNSLEGLSDIIPHV
jgi:glycosyltransferase involved in cell wall biosynthesis